MTATEMGDMDRKAAGLGYTVLAWTRDGLHWQRDNEPFIPNDPVPGRWDHAMAWGDEQILVGDETYLYYGGYERGHKVARYDERQIGLATMPRDRYVAREADLNPGRLVTRPLLFNGSDLTINAEVVGTLRVRLLDRDSEPLPGFRLDRTQRGLDRDSSRLDGAGFLTHREDRAPRIRTHRHPPVRL